ncbi:type IV pilin [Natronobacterium texcoconense]|uniref:Flagellin N-terminal-like domain-containing protein n=1 Tax=Natronobacterium texcoconense TaxID=1095778 RepID=A0A1H1I9N1_NATTX|nr:type IV pilin N-terminal domain-containing protein [Natronobacterium texcoconense]SDR34401.1 flagellin N-terminal-like domain-containing protein [Natronobacterium texcoconense]
MPSAAAECCEADRGVSPLVGALALIVITVCLAAVVAVGAASWSLESTGPNAAVELEVDGDGSVLVFDHVAGDSIDVRELTLTIAIDGTELSHQPQLPFVGTEGFDGAPSGPFNAESDPHWRTGERATLTVADTNEPLLESGDTVTVVLAVDGHALAELEATA